MTVGMPAASHRSRRAKATDRFTSFSTTPAAEAQYRRMMDTPIPRLVTSLAVPTVIGMLITVIYNTADTYFVSQINKSASAAVGAVYAVMAIVCKALTREDCLLLPKGEKIAKLLHL